ncbi:7971_t:CDS:2 [Entrophospora sp. SA101]|nr:7971_t:CDS:2 [Entrophospora sp. SA101]
MSFHVYQILELGPLQPNEQVFENFTDSRTGAPSTTEDLNTIHQTPSNEITTQHPTHPTPSGEIVLHPSQKFMQVKQKFESYILYQYPCVPCSFCSRLLYPEKAKWTQKIENFECPLIQANLNLRLIENPNPPENHIAVCSSLQSKQPGSLWFDRSLIAGANWLADNNPYLREYKNALVTNSSGSVSSFHTGTHLPDDETAPEFQSGDIIVPHQNFPSEIHNEDSHYSRLIAGFIKNDDSNDDSNSLPVSFDFDHLEALLFPDLFPDGHGDYKEMKSCSRNQQQRIDTYGKYIKQRLLGVDSRLPTAVEIIEESAYMSGWRFSETNASTIPSFIQTGDTYFNQKLMHLNTMIQNLNLPTLFITLSMAEGHWIHLHHILGSSDNFNTVPSNRPLHTTLHFIHRHQNLKRLIWKDPDVSGWGTCKDFFEHVEFQNRGAAHTHSVYWTSKPIEEMISENVIQSDVPDPNLEPELYECVMRLQIHSCNSKCDGPVPYARPNGEPFDNITYKDYIEQYDIKLSAINSSSQTIYRDNLGNYVVKRKTNILTRYRNLWLEHGELYFNQNLLLRVPARSEGDLIGTYETYRDHYLVRFPEEFGNSIKSDQQNQHHQTINMLDQYTNLIENLLYSLQSLLTQDIKGIIRSQLENIKILPPIVPNNTYVSLSRCSKWEDVKINSLSRDAFKVDPSMIKEYEHLEEIVTRPLPYTVHGAHQFANNSS